MKLTQEQIRKRSIRLRLKLKRRIKTVMAIKMSVSKESIKAPEPVDEDLYTFRLDGFKPDFTKNKNSINFNPQYRIVSGKNTGDKFKNKQVFDNMNQAAGWIQRDMVHATGLDMEEADGELSIPGKWNGDPQTPTTLKYEGPLVGKTFQAYVVKVAGNNNKFYNKIKYYVCVLPDCNKKYPDQAHSTDLT